MTGTQTNSLVQNETISLPVGDASRCSRCSPLEFAEKHFRHCCIPSVTRWLFTTIKMDSAVCRIGPETIVIACAPPPPIAAPVCPCAPPFFLVPTEQQKTLSYDLLREIILSFLRAGERKTHIRKGSSKIVQDPCPLQVVTRPTWASPVF